MRSPGEFRLSKWYMDGVSDSGEAFIGYAAELNWKRLKLGYASVLDFEPAAGLRSATTLHGFDQPELCGDVVRWRAPALRTTAAWAGPAGSSAITHRLFESPAGVLDWRCHLPRARFTCDRLEGPSLEGWGYVEQLDMRVLPWNLPIDELRWGRFVSPTDSLVWIEWRGPSPLRVVYHNGRLVSDAGIEDDQVTLDGGRGALALTDGVVIREGTLASVLFPAAPWLGKLIPSRFLATWECKWRSRGAMSCGGADPSTGWAIHEVVRFGGRSTS
jgi:hypothetical protein